MLRGGFDLGLGLFQADLGRDLGKAVARKLVIYRRWTGRQSQISTLSELRRKSDRIRSALTYARDNLHSPLTVADIAGSACLSPPRFGRAFQAETGQWPAKAVETFGVETARTLMERNRQHIGAMARQTGFPDGDRMRRAFGALSSDRLKRSVAWSSLMVRFMARLPVLRPEHVQWRKLPCL